MNEINDKRQAILEQIAERAKLEPTGWVNIDDIHLRPINALVAEHLLEFNLVDGKRLARVTATGREYLNVDNEVPRSVPPRATDINPMESEVSHVHRGAPKPILGPFPQVKTTPPPAPPRIQGGEKQHLDIDGHDCKECVYREVVEMLARKDPRVSALVDTLERERTLLDEMGLERKLSDLLESE